MADTLYDTDALAWSERQADLLRRLAAGERLNEAVDWENVIDEVESVGQSELRACRSYLEQALIHALKLYVWPASSARRHWREELDQFLSDAEAAFAPSMRARIDLDQVYGRALRRAMRVDDEARAARAFPDTCPFTLDDLLAADPDALLAKLDAPATP